MNFARRWMESDVQKGIKAFQVQLFAGEFATVVSCQHQRQGAANKGYSIQHINDIACLKILSYADP